MVVCCTDERIGDSMNLITVKDVANKWNISERRVQKLCIDGRIKGAHKVGPIWMIPDTAVLPTLNKELEDPHLPMPKKTPFLDMTNIYNEKGKADICGEMLINNKEAYELYKAQIAYRRGEIDKVYDKARYFLKAHSGLYAILGAGMLLAQCAIWRGDIDLWNEAKKHICEAPTKTKEERDIVSLALAIVDSSIYDNKDYPSWFKIGNFELLPADSHPSCKVFYVKYLYMAAFAVASKEIKIEGVEGLSIMKMIPFTIEPLISQAVVDKTIIPEIYLRMSCAVAYHNVGLKEFSIGHLDKAIKLALADNLYGILTEYIRHFDGLLEERVGLISKEAVIIINELYSRYKLGWAKVSGTIRNKYIATNLTPREHEVAKLSVFGFSVKEISAMLYISESSVKQTISRILSKTGVEDKNQFVYII
jgi:DNA-binding NarL/FixJ family response regulator